MLPIKDDNPPSRFAWVSVVLIVLNVIVFIGPQGMNDPQRVQGNVALEWAAIPCEVITGDGITAREVALTFSGRDSTACDADPTGSPVYPDKPTRLALVFSMFMHGGWLHLLGNIWFLWLFGNNVEDHLGPLRYLAFYLAGGVVASIAHIAVQPDSTIPVVGASGAVAAVMGAYAVWFPEAPIRTLVVFFLLRIRAKWWLGFWLVSQFFVGADSRVAWMAHVGGFVFGIAVGWLIRRSPSVRDRAFTPAYRTGEPWDPTGRLPATDHRRPT